jgi:23S rRNA (guanosine2251-2'-O)-methyltransferase
MCRMSKKRIKNPANSNLHIKNQGFNIDNYGSYIKNQNPRIKNQGPHIKNQGPRIKNQGSHINTQSYYTNNPVYPTPREDGGTENDSGILEGRNPVMEALRSGRDINKLLILRGNREGSINKIIAMAKERGIVIQETDKQGLDNISLTGAHQGVIAYVASAKYAEVEDILERAASRGEPPFVIILDGITDGHNLGAIIRTADCVGAHGVILPKRRSAGLNPVVAKASAGAVEYVPVARVTNISRIIELLKSHGLWVVGTDATGNTAIFEKDLTGPIALVIGSEGEGIGRLVAEKCDFIIRIPMAGSVTSLNASVAAAVAMYEVYRQRQKR